MVGENETVKTSIHSWSAPARRSRLFGRNDRGGQSIIGRGTGVGKAIDIRKARLVIAKLDRLSRNLAFIAALMDSGVEFVAVDNPHATRLTLHILAAVAEHERHMIADRTKAALQAAKVRGIRLGRNGSDQLAPAYHAAAIERARQLAPVLAELKGAGMSARQIAVQLAARDIPTPTGARWHAQTVIRMLERAGC